MSQLRMTLGSVPPTETPAEKPAQRIKDAQLYRDMIIESVGKPPNASRFVIINGILMLWYPSEDVVCRQYVRCIDESGPKTWIIDHSVV